MHDPNDPNNLGYSQCEDQAESGGFTAGCLNVLIKLILGFVALLGLGILALFIICM